MLKISWLASAGYFLAGMFGKSEGQDWK